VDSLPCVKKIILKFVIFVYVVSLIEKMLKFLQFK
jgi:hypothetical protein